MSPKELLYIEDTLGHEKQITSTCKESAKKLQDTELQNVVMGIAKNQSDTFNKFYGLLGG